MRTPDLFIIGAPRSGTTSLYEYLRAHPEVFMSPIKEPTYFCPDLPPNAAGRLPRYGVDHEGYLELFAGATDAKRAGEASVRYLSSVEAPRLIAEFEPRPYVVASLRNPVDMVHSLHAHHVAGGSEDIDDFAEAIAAEDDRRAGRRIPPRSNAVLSVYTDRARYGEQLERWFAAIERSRFHVMIFEDFLRQPQVEYRALLEFLEVDADHRPEAFAAFNARHAARSRLLRRMLNGRLPQWVVWQAMPRLIGQNRTRGLARSFRHSRAHRQAAERAPIAPELRRRLEDLFEDDVRRLGELLGRDMLGYWFERGNERTPVAAGAGGARGAEASGGSAPGSTS